MKLHSYSPHKSMGPSSFMIIPFGVLFRIFCLILLFRLIFLAALTLLQAIAVESVSLGATSSNQHKVVQIRQIYLDMVLKHFYITYRPWVFLFSCSFMRILPRPSFVLRSLHHFINYCSFFLLFSTPPLRSPPFICILSLLFFIFTTFLVFILVRCFCSFLAFQHFFIFVV